MQRKDTYRMFYAEVQTNLNDVENICIDRDDIEVEEARDIIIRYYNAHRSDLQTIMIMSLTEKNNKGIPRDQFTMLH